MQPGILILMIQVAATWFMVGLIWLIQIVHYPLFAEVGLDTFSRYSARHQFLITWIVGPVMVAELLTAAILAWYPPSPPTSLWLKAGLALLLVIWVSTAVLQALQHGRLSAGFDLDRIHALVRWNWIRTIAWTARGLILLVVLQRLLAMSANSGNNP